MSRRKQGRPQQRKTLDSLEKERDLLVCGDCQTSFALQDIVLFIKHKKQCCDKENLAALDNGQCRKPGGDGSNNNNNNNEPNEQRSEEHGHESSKSSRRDDDDEEEDLDEDSEYDGEDNAMDTSGHSLVNGDHDLTQMKLRRKDASSRTPLRQKQVVDAESNTTHSEPSRFICETCRHTYTSAWALLQHAQKEHGMKIYTSPSSSSNSQSTTPVPMSPLDLVMASSSPRSGLDHRSVSSAGSGGSASPFPVHAPNPFSSPFRLPLDSRLVAPTSISPFPRASFDFDLINDYRLRPQLICRPTGAIDATTLTSTFERTRAHLSPAFDSNYDYYSMRLKQLASSPLSTQPKSQFSVNQSTNAGTPTSKPSSPSVDATSVTSPKGSSTSPALVLPPRLKSCEFCGKSFRFQSNLVVHRRSHTGEKPYKCPLCPHACTQQSKLKRHMKTHSNKTETTAAEVSKLKDDEEDADEDEDDDDDEDNEEDDDEEEELDNADIAEEDMNEEEREALKGAKSTKNKEETTPEPGEIRHEAKRIKLERQDDKTEEDTPSDLSMKAKPAESLLSEVMKNSVLNSIPTYTEAFKAALAEREENSKDKNDKNSDDSGDDKDSPLTGSPKSPRSGVKRELDSEKDSDKDEPKERLYLGSTELLSNSLKKDSAAPANWSAVDPIYRGIHYPILYPENQLNIFFQNYPHRFSSTREVNSEGHNGLNLSPSVATTSSALKTDSPSIPSLYKPSLTSPPSFPSSHRRGTSSSSSSPTGSLLLPSNGNNAPNSAKKDSRRNDTCEFCGKVFKNCSNLTVHRRSHTGEKPYKCSLCSYACAQSSKLTRHMKTHGRLGKDVYTCKFCNMPFSVPSTLEKHMRKCVENRNARLLPADGGDDMSSESNGEVSRQSDSASGVY